MWQKSVDFATFFVQNRENAADCVRLRPWVVGTVVGMPSLIQPHRFDNLAFVFEVRVLIVLGHLVRGVAAKLRFDLVLAGDTPHHGEEGMTAGVRGIFRSLARLRLFLYSESPRLGRGVPKRLCL